MITAVISRKGGVGKTTTSVNLAAALAAAGRQVLLVDLDSQASSSLSLGVSRSELAPSAADLLLGSLPADAVVRATHLDGLDLITASADLASIDGELSPLADREKRLQRALAPIADDYEFVFLDCPPSLPLASLNALVAADSFVLTTVPHYLAMAGVDNLVHAVERLVLRHGSRTRFLGLVLTMVDYRTRANRRNVAQLRACYGRQVFAVEIRVNIRLAEAPEAGKTIFEYDASSTGARAYRLLAEEFLMRANGAARGRTGSTADEGAGAVLSSGLMARG